MFSRIKTLAHHVIRICPQSRLGETRSEGHVDVYILPSSHFLPCRPMESITHAPVVRGGTTPDLSKVGWISTCQSNQSCCLALCPLHNPIQPTISVPHIAALIRGLRKFINSYRDPVRLTLRSDKTCANVCSRMRLPSSLPTPRVHPHPLFPLPTPPHLSAALTTLPTTLSTQCG